MKKLLLPLIMGLMMIFAAVTGHKGAAVYAMAISPALLDSRRKAYQNAVEALEADQQYVVNNMNRALKTNKKNIRVAQSYVWSEIPLNANTSDYVLNVIDQQYNVGNTNLLPSERRIKQQDVFFSYALFFGIRVTVANWQGQTQQIMTFPSATVNGPAPFLFPDIDALLGIWNLGDLNVTVNGDVLTPAWDMSQHLVINQTQASIGGVPPNPNYDQVNQAEDGWLITEPNWIINGGNNNLYQVTYPNNYSSIFGGVNASTTSTVNLIMRLDGFLAQNASSIMNNAPQKGV